MDKYHSPTQLTFVFNGSRVRTNRKCSMAIAVVVFLSFTICYMTYIYANGQNEYLELTVLDDEYIAEWHAEDPRLIKHIRDHYLTYPADRSVPYNLIDPDKKHYSQKKQSEVIERLLAYQRNGFFIEAGAFDGETWSNTLSFEKYYNWSGVLVEPDYVNWKNIISKNRKAWVVKGCLESGEKPKRMTLVGANGISYLEKYNSFSKALLSRVWQPMYKQNVWCFPLISILQAVNRTKYDYFSLDVEGSELAVLKSIPWSKVDINAITIEFIACQGIYYDKDISTKRKAEIRQFMRENLPQYKEAAVIFHDMVYIKHQLGSLH